MINNYKKYFAEILKKQTEIDIDEITKNITIVPENISGDLSFPCFQLSKVLKKSPNDISKDLAEKLSTDDHFTKFEAIGGFLNAHIDQSSFVSSFFSSTDTSYNNEDQKVLIEYMSANPNKPLHIGQARNICIGDSMANIFKYLKYTTHTTNYGDDSGVNVGYNIVGHMHYNHPLETDKKYDHYCGEIYSEMRKIDEDPKFKELLSTTLQKIEAGDPEILKLHKTYTKKCALEQIKSCRRVGASFDLINRETDILHLDFFAEAIELLKAKGYIKFADDDDAKGCRIIDLSSLPEYANQEKQYQIIIKSDGVATYIAKDIAFSMRKLGYLKKDFYYESFAKAPNGNEIFTTTSTPNEEKNTKFGHYNTAITVIDNRQIPAQEVVKSSLKLMGYLNEEKQYNPLGYGVVYLTPQTLIKLGYELSDEEKAEKRLPFASRKGRTVTLDETMDMLHKKAYEETRERNSDKDEERLNNTAEKIAISSLRFLLLKGDISRDIVFDIDETLNMEGETGAYILYTGARIQSIIDQNGNIDAEFKNELLTNENEFTLIKKLSEFENTIMQTKNEIAPHFVCKYLLELSSLANSYYAHTKILVDDQDLKNARIHLLKKTTETLKKGMNLIGMEFLSRM